MSAEDFGQMTADLMGRRKPYARQTVYQWERWTRDDDLPRGYWTRYAMPRKVEKVLKAFVVLLVAHRSRGRYAARVTGRHEWTVTLRRTP